MSWDFSNASNGAIFGAVAVRANNYAYAEAIGTT
jgi:hypothetical protein